MNLNFRLFGFEIQIKWNSYAIAIVSAPDGVLDYEELRYNAFYLEAKTLIGAVLKARRKAKEYAIDSGQTQAVVIYVADHEWEPEHFPVVFRGFMEVKTEIKTNFFLSKIQ